MLSCLPLRCSPLAATATNRTSTVPFSKSKRYDHRRYVSDMTNDDDRCLPWNSQPLGHPLPTDEHACSVSLPTWSSVVGYEEGDQTITAALRCGYPRFVYHPYVIQLMQVALELHGNGNNEDCLVLPSKQSAGRCQRFLLQALYGTKVTDNAFDDDDADNDPDPSSSSSNCSTAAIRTVPLVGSVGSVADAATGVHAVFFPAQTTAGMAAKAYWQHTGEVVSSRRAEQALLALGRTVAQRVTVSCSSSRSKNEVKEEGEAQHVPQVRSSSSCPASISKIRDSNRTNSNKEDPFDELRDRIGGWAQVPTQNVFLTPSGMASIYTALRSARRYQMSQTGRGGGGRSIVYGFPYLDTLKLCSRPEFCPDGVEFFGLGDELDLGNLEQLLVRSRARKQQLLQEQHNSSSVKPNAFCALFTEVPSNPLLQCPDLYKLRELADEFDFLLIVDDTISNFLNANLLQSGLADAVCSSLTKLVSGRGDAMAGSIVANPHTRLGQWMQRDLHEKLQRRRNNNDDGAFGLFSADARALLANSVDFVERNERINANAEGLADWFHNHEDVERVYYPKMAEPCLYASQVQKGGFGGLMSITLHPHMCQRMFYDSLNVAKGPSLGTNYTLVCPYTLLAHYHELDFAISCNVPPNLLRISVGMEPLETLKAKFESAFKQGRLHPKVCLERVQRRAYSTASSSNFAQTRNLRQVAKRLLTLVR